MAKYFITLVLLVCLALENRNVYNRLHARSHPSSRADILRPHPKHQSHPHVQHTSQQLQLQQQHHIRQQRSRQLKNLEPDPAGEEDEAPISKQEYYARLRSHVIQKRQHLLEQELSYNRPPGEQLKVPRLWNLLMEQEEKAHRHQNPPESEEFPLMFGDAPEGSAFSSEEQFEDLSPLDFVRNELMAGEQKNLEEKDPDAELEPQVPEESDIPIGERNITISVKPRGGGGGCPKCESSRQVEHITEEQLTHLRIEFVKQQILEKLRLKESPKVSAVELPKPIFDGMTLSHPDDSTKNKELDDYYARTSKKFILLNREEVECSRLGGGKSNPSMCFSFKIDDADAEGFDVSTAVLWLFKNKQNRTQDGSVNGTSSQQTIVVSEVQVDQQKDSKYLTAAKTIAIQSVNAQDDEWMKIDIEWPIKHWMSGHELSHLIQISCGGCDVTDMEELISVDKDYRPFIVIDMQNRRRKSRQKRSVNCSSGMTECCREHLYISFRDIGWSNWILKPEGYNAYFCRGSCSSVASVTQAASHHSSIMKILSTSGANKSLELVPCCTAKQYSSLQLVVMDSRNTATVKTLPNMVVESCGCR
ncbi:LOW QUALITY PROTEIN: inhibin beta A chain [Drosophila ficusphila]|uniref:LOW QUALITY PROTEIN: inhibin beta A chain n=1 Tax=Drosophila ficusphila TaxID=30025 RepID=UPI0007E6C1FC|nr:LOW QUALITY PROTEIN: inhibin beta A chain [Drosophila ficusphila]